jgi:crotonobetainyl-CoA:carnitine CoA-transferase CaiB-like acyl-CoA transferase
MLSPYRVLDLTDERGLLCGQVLGDLGADVIAIEPPGGSPARRIGPFYHDDPHPDRSLFWWAFNRNKRSITLDVEKTAGRAVLLRLAERSHVFIESDDAGAMAERGLGYDDLAAVNPAIVYVSISAFGRDGPKSGYAASDLVAWAAGGPLALTGDEDRPPVRLSLPQAFLHASADAAVGALIALIEAQRSGRGQRVDAAAQHSATQATFATSLSAPLGWPAIKRYGGGFRYGPLPIPGVHRAKDGCVTITFLFGNAIGPMSRRMMEYVCEEGFCDTATRDKDWVAYADLLLSGQEPMEEFERVLAILRDFIASKTKGELLQAALERGLLIAPVTTIGEVAQSEQLAARDYWREVEHPELGETVRYAGPFAKFSETPIAYRHRPPTAGEHNREVYVHELGLTDAALADLEARSVV